MTEWPAGEHGPYKGLEPYSEGDADFFFGREAERQIIIANLMSARLTLFYGPTGAGKTSLLQAGVLNDLHAMAQENIQENGIPRFLPVIFSGWHAHPVAGLITAIEEAVAGYAPEERSQPPVKNTTLAGAIETWTSLTGAEFSIVLDQFEEYFTYHQGEQISKGLVQQIPEVIANPELRANFLISIREDALAKLDVFKGQIPDLFDNYLRMRHLDVRAARDAIEKPIEQYNRLVPRQSPKEIEAPLVDAILYQLTAGEDMGVEVPPTLATSQNDGRVEAPFLQVIMARLWAYEMQADSNILRLDSFKKLGGAKRIVESHLDAGMQTLARNDQDAAARMFKFLVTPGGSKIAHSIEDLSSHEYTGLPVADVRRVVDRLSERDLRILRAADAADERYEISHDVLADPILEWRTRHLQSRHRRRMIVVATAAAVLVALIATGVVVKTITLAHTRISNTKHKLHDAHKTAKSLKKKNLDLTKELKVRGIVFTSTAFHGNHSAGMRHNYDLYVIRKDKGVTQLTNEPGDDSSPAWSPDGTRIAFHSNRTGRYEIYTIKPDGSGLKRLTHNALDDITPAWSPDGKRIAFARDRAQSQDILAMDSDGKNVTPLTDDHFFDAFPSWSSTGKRIAFQSCRPAPRGCQAQGADNIWIMDSKGHRKHQLTTAPGVDEFAPRWSPHGNKIVYFGERNKDPATEELYVINADGTGLTRLTNNRWVDAAPTWSGDGKRIAFYSNRGGDDEIYVMDASAGAKVTQLTHNNLSDQYPAWAPWSSL